MTDAELLKEVKKRMGVTGEYQDDTLTGYIQDVKDFLLDAGVDSEILRTNEVIGVVTRGVFDLWIYGSGFSSYFFQRVTQLAFKKEKNE